MDIPANRARIAFTLEGTPYAVISLQGEERLNLGFYFQIDIQTAFTQHAEDLDTQGLFHLALLGFDTCSLPL